MTIPGLWCSIALAIAASGDSSPAPIDPAKTAQVRAYEQARVRVIEKAAPAVVCMFAKGNRAGGGSGVVIDSEGYGLTNFHVVAMMIDQRVGEGGLSDHQVYPLDVLGMDPTGDVAMFKLNRKEPFAFAPPGDSDSLRVGDYTLAMGNPFLLAEDFTPTVTLGIVSGLHRYQWGSKRALSYTDCIQVDTSINPGNSGGPLFDMEGNVVGINGRVSIEERGRVNVGVGYAITINQIRRFMPALRAGLMTPHATAGFTVFERHGVLVIDQILDDSPAYKAGLRLNDRLVSFAGRTMSNVNQFVSWLGTFPGGWPVDATFKRGDDTKTVRFRLEDLPLPKPDKKGPQSGPNLTSNHPMAKRANRRAVRRAFDRYLDALGGGRAATAAMRSIEATGKRRWADRPQDPPSLLNEKQTRPSEPDPGIAVDSISFEQAVRWSLLSPMDDPSASGYQVVGGDELAGRIVQVIERHAADKTDFRLYFEEASGRLLGLTLVDPTTRRNVRIEYDDFRHTGPVRLPHVRRMYLDDRPYAEDVFDKLQLSSSTH